MRSPAPLELVSGENVGKNVAGVHETEQRGIPRIGYLVREDEPPHALLDLSRRLAVDREVTISAAANERVLLLPLQTAALGHAVQRLFLKTRSLVR